MGGHFMFDDDQQTPNNIITVFEFPDTKGGGDKKKILQFEVRHWITNREAIKSETPQAESYKISSDNTVGNLFYGSLGFMSKNVNEWETFMGNERTPGEKGNGIGNHYENFINAIRANDQKLAKGDIREAFYSCALVHLGNISYRLGRSLEFDPVKMKFINDAKADAMLTRQYRYPFVVPDNV